MEEAVNFSCTDPQLLKGVFFQLTNSEDPLTQIFSLREESFLSSLFDRSSIQDSSRFRSLRRARVLSEMLINSRGELDSDALKKMLLLFEKAGHIFYPDSSEETLPSLRSLENKEVARFLKKFYTPLCHAWAERLVRSTLGLPSAAPLSDVEVRRAALCAYLTPLRQNVGSCFATAPAIVIQKDQPLRFLDDLQQLLSKGKLKRIFGGIEYAIPLSPSTGVGDLRKNVLAPHASLCPGLITACQILGVCSPSDPPEFQSRSIEVLIQQFGQGKKILTVEALIQAICLKQESLTSQDLDKQTEWESAQVRQFQMGVRGFSSSSSEKIRRLQHFKNKCSEAQEAFKGLCDNALIKAWEFTLASFSEVKMEFSKWNFYVSLGFSTQETGGIGELLFTRLNEKVEEINKKLHQYQLDYQLSFDQVRATETLLRNASSEGDARRLRAEYQSRAYHMRSCQELRDELYEKGSHYSGLLSFLLKQYDQKFPEYFQEIYDAQMQDVAEGAYEDSPAGFRLVYKQGRVDPSTWTLIENENQYIQSLTDFFSLTQTSISAECEWEEGVLEIRDLTEQILFHLREPRFLTSALERMAKAYQTNIPNTPLFSLHQIEKKPWAYTSGGTMTTLLKTYYCRESEFTSESKWVESPQDLLIFILDTLKNLFPRVLDPYLKGERTGMLMNSPTHAFVLLPEPIKAGWQTDGFTYTWVRDEILAPGQQFYAKIQLEREEQEFLFHHFCDSHSLPLIPNPFLSHKSLTPLEWRQALLAVLTTPGFADQIDAFLYQSLPLIPGSNWKELAKEFLVRLGSSLYSPLLKQFPDRPVPYFTAAQFHDLVTSCYLVAEETVCFPFDVGSQVASIGKELGTIPPTSLLVADTNWSGNYFAFVVNPGTLQLDLWRMNKALTKGVPMSQWRQWLNGQQKQPWTLFTQPHEYSS